MFFFFYFILSFGIIEYLFDLEQLYRAVLVSDNLQVTTNQIQAF